MEFSVLQNQENLLAKLTTPFGESDIVIKFFEGREAISELFEFSVVFNAKDKALDLENALGANINISIKADNLERNINGIISEFSQGATEKEDDVYLTEYAAVIRPKMWLMSLDKNFLMFQNKSAIDIIKQVISDAGITDLEDKTNSCGKAEREYCVQYNESSFNFISRLMEDEGIFYFFKHEKSKHTLVLGDSSSVHEKVSGESKIGLIKSVNDVYPLGKVFNTKMTASVNTGGYSTADYNYTISQTKLFSALDGKWKGQNFYEYPGKYGAIGEGDSISKIRVQQFEFIHCLLYGESTAANLTPGLSFELVDHHSENFNKEFTIRYVKHFFHSNSTTGFIYKNEFCAFEKGIEFRPERKTQKPRISGTQTAIVVCPSGEEIFRNEHGCIKVHFHWDQIGKDKDADDSSCWIRVAQILAGSGWGALFIPRVGQEVVVAFIDGDPDRPIIVGCVYNDKYLPPYPDGESMKSALKTVTFKDDEQGFNEFRFNDEKDSEEIYVHAQKDMYVNILNSRKTEIEESHDTLDLFKGSRTITLQAKGDDPANHSLFLKKGDSIVELTEGNHSYTITKGNEEITLGDGNRTVTLSNGNMTCDVTGDYTLTVSGNITIKAGGNVAIEAGGSMSLKSATDTKIEAGTGIKVQAGTEIGATAGTSLSAKAGMAASVEAGTDISLKSGASFSGQSGANMMLQAGANLNGNAGVNVNFNAGASLMANAAATAQISGGAVLNAMGGGAVNVKGGIVNVGAALKIGS